MSNSYKFERTKKDGFDLNNVESNAVGSYPHK